MSEAVKWAFFLIASYFAGAIPFGFLIARARGVDIRTVGSGNIGATNVFRSVGKPWGIATFILDALKGYLPAAILPGLCGVGAGDLASPELARLAGGAAAILGHSFPIFLGFRGGKGVATGAGALMGIAPVAGLMGLATWAVVFFASRYVSLASITAAVAVSVSAWVWHHSANLTVPSALTLLAALVVYRHKDNIRRLLAGTEHRFSRAKSDHGSEMAGGA